MDKVIQIANLIQGGKRKNPQRGRIYSAQGCSPCLNGIGGGRRFRTEILMDKAKVTTPPTRLRYALGRSNHGNENDKYGTSRFRANPYFNTVTAIQMSNRRQWIIEI